MRTCAIINNDYSSVLCTKQSQIPFFSVNEQDQHGGSGGEGNGGGVCVYVCVYVREKGEGERRECVFDNRI